MSESFRIRLVASADNFTGRLALAAEAGHALNVRLALQAATWEPHDWSTFDAAKAAGK